MAEGIHTYTQTHIHTHTHIWWWGREYVTSLYMAKGGKGKKEGKTKATSSQASPPTPAAAAAAPAAAKISPTPSPIPKIALVDDDGVADAAVLARAKEVLDANRATLGEVGFGGGKPTSYMDDNGALRSLPENWLYGIDGDVQVSFAPIVGLFCPHSRSLLPL